MKDVALREELFEGVVSLETQDGWIRPWRLPVGCLPLFDSDLVAGAEQPAGGRLRFATEAAQVGLKAIPADPDRYLDLTVDGELLQTAMLPSGRGEVRFDGLPVGRKVLELWLPHDQPVQLTAVQLSDGAEAEVVPDDRPRWTTYGSSISHCRGAHSPARTWPATAARLKGANLTSFGFAGQCHLDAMVAMAIRDVPADLISLKVGINIRGASSLSPRTFAPALIAMVRIIREAQPDTPIAVVSPIVSPPRETMPNAAGLSLTMMRDQLADAVQRLAACGDASLHYFDGLELFGPDFVEPYLPDELHPNADGYEVLGQRFAELVLGKLLPARRCGCCAKA